MICGIHHYLKIENRDYMVRELLKNVYLNSPPYV